MGYGVHVFLFLVFCGMGLEVLGDGESSGLIRNPVMASGADPWVICRGEFYYMCQSRRGSIWVGRFRRLRDLGMAEWVKVWTPEPGTEHSRELWAPELHHLRGRWYIYVAADDGENRNHRMFVLEGDEEDPRLAFRMRGRLAADTDRWAIDGTVLEMPGGGLYFLWSGWEGFENVAQHLYIAGMSDPWTIRGERVRISSPEHVWERRGEPWVNEGPQVLWRGGRLFVIYSASGSWTDDYCLGQLSWGGGDPLDPASWSKKPEPVFSSAGDVYGPGHCSFVRTRDGEEDWMIYHSAKHRGAGWNRRVNMQRFGWTADGDPDFGVPRSSMEGMKPPSGEE
ncbi:MAG: hypothetical protein RI897_4428 [Verrucomicrobiota bacterium]